MYFGAGAYGVEAASRTYFHKSAAKLTLKEAALLAALIRLPSKYSPTTDPKQAKERRDLVLDTMAAEGYITQAEADATKAKKLGVRKHPPTVNDSEAAYFVDYVTRQLIKKYGAAQTFNGGLRVHTSIDMKWQEAALASVSGTIGGLDYGGWGPAGALVAIDPETGFIRAMVGGTDFEKKKFNLAWQSRRQAGSAMKPFVLTSAVEMGMNPASTYYVSHSPTIIPMGPGAAPWIVNTYDHSSAGRITVSAATVRSDNSVYAQLCMDTGPENVVATAQKMGIKSPLAAVPSITLGTEVVNPLEMASAYATLASGGIYRPPQAIVKVVVPGGKVDWKPKTKGRRVLSAGVGLHGEQDPPDERQFRHRRGDRRIREPHPGRQDGHDRRLRRRLVLRLHAQPRHRGLDGVSGRHPAQDARRGRLHLLRADVGQVQPGRARRPAHQGLRVRPHGLQAVEGQVLDDVAVGFGEQRLAEADGDQDDQAHRLADADPDADPDADADADQDAQADADRRSDVALLRRGGDDRRRVRRPVRLLAPARCQARPRVAARRRLTQPRPGHRQPPHRDARPSGSTMPRAALRLDPPEDRRATGASTAHPEIVNLVPLA